MTPGVIFTKFVRITPAPTLAAFGIALALTSLSAQQAAKTFIPFRDAVQAIDTSRRNLPPELFGKTSAGVEAAWPEWVRQRDAAIRARLERGDEDSIVYYWQFGTSFTSAPAATERNVARLGGADAAASLLERRVAGHAQIAAPCAPFTVGGAVLRGRTNGGEQNEERDFFDHRARGSGRSCT